MDGPTTPLKPPPPAAADLPEPERTFEVRPVEPAPDPDRGDRRRLLWRDSATLLVFVVLAVLAGQIFFPPTAGPGESQPVESGVVVGSLPPGMSLPPGVTFGPIVDPSIGIDRTPTPIPAITDFPTPTPKITPKPTPTRKPTPKPSVKPSVAPSPGGSPAATPTATPAITTPPAPLAAFTYSQSLPLRIAFTDTSTIAANWTWAWEWNFGDGSAHAFAQNPSHTYALPGTYNVTLTVTGPGGTDSVSRIVPVSAT